jgi:hypothetical protein
MSNKKFYTVVDFEAKSMRKRGNVRCRSWITYAKLLQNATQMHRLKEKKNNVNVFVGLRKCLCVCVKQEVQPVSGVTTVDKQ